MEAYDRTNAGCRTAVLTFLDAGRVTDPQRPNSIRDDRPGLLS